MHRILAASWKSIATLIAIVVALTACGDGRGPLELGPDIGVDNGTTLPVTIVVNGMQVETVPPDTQRSVRTGLSAMPWRVEAVTPTGRILLVLDVPAGIVWETVEPGGVVSQHGAANRIDLSCGRLDLYVGPPLAGPMPGPGEPGDCEP